MRDQTADDVHRLIKQAERWLRLEAADKMTVLMTCVIVWAVMFALIASAIFFISMAVMKSIAAATGDEVMSCCIVGGALLFVALMFYLLRKPLVENKVVQSVSSQMLEDDEQA